MDHLYIELAPIPAPAWEQIDDEAKSRLPTYLAGRKLVDFAGPHGWTHSATNLGRTTEVHGPGGNVTARQRRVLPLIELRADFTVGRDELDDAARGAAAIDLAELGDALKQIAVAENAAVFHGFGPGDIVGVTQASSHSPLTLTDDMARYPTTVAQAVNTLLGSGISGPYGMAISPDGYTGIVETAEHGGYPLLEHLRHILNGPLVWAPGVDGAVVMSLRGGDFVLDVGQDISIGYRHHDADAVQLYLEESFSFRVIEPDAAIALVYPS